jgi:hypothetical protein
LIFNGARSASNIVPLNGNTDPVNLMVSRSDEEGEEDKDNGDGLGCCGDNGDGGGVVVSLDGIPIIIIVTP